MPVYSHSKNDGKTRVGSKLLIDHLQGVRDLAIENLSDRIHFSVDDSNQTVDCFELLDSICWLHDLGKYTGYFQAYLLEPGKFNSRLKAHSNLGAHTAFSLHKEQNNEHALLAYYIIKLHHSNLLNLDQVLYPDGYSGSRFSELDIFEKQKKNLAELNELHSFFPAFDPGLIRHHDAKELFGLYKKALCKSDCIANYFKVNYLFSLLIESDKLDASDTDLYQRVSLPADAVDKKFGKPEVRGMDLQNLTQNELRNFVRAEVVGNLKQSDILEKRIFTLAAPTGIGKTMTSLDFALKLRKKIEIEEEYLPQVIYGLPFINIIEQALGEYENTLDSGKILGHYQYADVFGSDSRQENTPGDEGRHYSQKQMSWDTWQSDIVITSFVQLFETLIGNRNKLLKKFHHFAGSIIILDEVQTLAIEKLPVVGAALYYLCKFMNARLIIMTATQPKLFELMHRELDIETRDKQLVPHNLSPSDNSVFACFNRTKIIPLIGKQVENENFIEIFKEKWTKEKSCLIVVNKVNRSIELYDLLKKILGEKTDVELFYLSTNITPVQRQSRIEEIKCALPEKTCILISTQVVEAGVDLNFDMGFRDLGPIDSIVQVAGRINRENSKEREGAPLYIIDFGDCRRIYDHATDIKSRNALQKKSIPEKEYKSMVESYFESVSDRKLSDFSISRDVFDAMKKLRYASPGNTSKNQITVSDFKIIENAEQGKSVFVELPDDETGSRAREAFLEVLSGNMPKHVFDKQYKRAFNQRIIAVPGYLRNVAELGQLTEEILWIPAEVAEYYYSSNTGFIRNVGQEHEETIFF